MKKNTLKSKRILWGLNSQPIDHQAGITPKNQEWKMQKTWLDTIAVLMQ